MALPESFIQHLRHYGYEPRSNKHSNALATAIVEDLLQRCGPMARQAEGGGLVYDLNMDLRFATSNWNVDLVLGTPSDARTPEGVRITRARPATVRIATEIKGVMTEHHKAVKNRKRDFEAHHEHVHNYNRRCIASGVLVINASSQFQSPRVNHVNSHGKDRAAVLRTVEHCINEMRNVTESGGNSGNGIDAKCVIVLDFDNITYSEGRFVTTPPAPQPGDPLHYDSFIQRLCDEYYERFGAGG